METTLSLRKGNHLNKVGPPSGGPTLKDTYMSDNLKLTHPADARRINIHQDHERKFWATHFGITQEMLVKLVKHHGDYAEDIAKVLRR